MSISDSIEFKPENPENECAMCKRWEIENIFEKPQLRSSCQSKLGVRENS